MQRMRYYLTRLEVAEELGCSANQVTRLLRSGAIKGLLVSTPESRRKKYLVAKPELVKYKKNNTL